MFRKKAAIPKKTHTISQKKDEAKSEITPIEPVEAPKTVQNTPASQEADKKAESEPVYKGTQEKAAVVMPNTDVTQPASAAPVAASLREENQPAPVMTVVPPESSAAASTPITPVPESVAPVSVQAATPVGVPPPTPAFGSSVSEGSSSGSKKWIFIFFGVVLLTVLLTSGGLYYYKNFMNKKPQKTISQLTSKPVNTPTPTEALTKTTAVQILNGSGIPGEAGKVAELLKSSGFEKIETGNADAYTYKTTQVAVREKTPKDVYDAIVKALEKNYIVTQSAHLKNSSQFDVVITVGSKKPR